MRQKHEDFLTSFCCWGNKHVQLQVRDQTHRCWTATVKRAVLAKKNGRILLFKSSRCASDLCSSRRLVVFFFFSLGSANLQLQINSSCLQHPSAVSPFFLPLLQFPPASQRFSALSRIHLSFPLLSLPPFIIARLVRSPRQQIRGKVFEPANSSSYVTADQKKKKHGLKKNGVQQVAANVHLRTSRINPPFKTATNEQSFIHLCDLFCYCQRVCVCIFTLELWRRISVRRRTSHGSSGERQQRRETEASVEN